MEHTSAQPANAKFVRSTILAVTTHAVAPALWLVILLFVVPRFAAIFSEISDGKAVLPVLTKIVLSCSAFFTRHWYIYPILLSPVFVMDAAVYYLLARHLHKALAYTWYLLILLAQVAATLMFFPALILPVFGPMTTIPAG